MRQRRTRSAGPSDRQRHRRGRCHKGRLWWCDLAFPQEPRHIHQIDGRRCREARPLRHLRGHRRQHHQVGAYYKEDGSGLHRPVAPDGQVAEDGRRRGGRRLRLIPWRSTGTPSWSRPTPRRNMRAVYVFRKSTWGTYGQVAKLTASVRRVIYVLRHFRGWTAPPSWVTRINEPAPPTFSSG